MKSKKLFNECVDRITFFIISTYLCIKHFYRAKRLYQKKHSKNHN